METGLRSYELFRYLQQVSRRLCSQIQESHRLCECMSSDETRPVAYRVRIRRWDNSREASSIKLDAYGRKKRLQVHDIRAKTPVCKFINLNAYQVTAITFNDTADQVSCRREHFLLDNHKRNICLIQIISGSIDCALKIWDLRRGLLQTCFSHTDTITGLALSPDGRHVLSNAMDCTARVCCMNPINLYWHLSTMQNYLYIFSANA